MSMDISVKEFVRNVNGLEDKNGVPGYKTPSTFHKPFERVETHAFVKDTGKVFGYSGSIQKLASVRIPPGQYQIKDKDGFKSDPKTIKFAYLNRAPRQTVLDEL